MTRVRSGPARTEFESGAESTQDSEAGQFIRCHGKSGLMTHDAPPGPGWPRIGRNLANIQSGI